MDEQSIRPLRLSSGPAPIPRRRFATLWNDARQFELRHRARESWDRLSETRRALLVKFVREELPRISGVTGSEKSFELGITDIETPFVGVIDLVAELDGKKSVVDFKTAGSTYADHEAQLSDQLTAYQLAELEVEQMALCVLVKTKEPKIDWFVSVRDSADLIDYLAKAGYVARDRRASLLQAARHVVLVVRFPAGVFARRAEGIGDFGESKLTVRVNKPARDSACWLFPYFVEM